MIFKQIYLTYDEALRVDLGVMAMKRPSILPRSPELDPHYQMQFSVISKTALFDGIFCKGHSVF